MAAGGIATKTQLSSCPIVWFIIFKTLLAFEPQACFDALNDFEMSLFNPTS